MEQLVQLTKSLCTSMQQQQKLHVEHEQQVQKQLEQTTYWNNKRILRNY